VEIAGRAVERSLSKSTLGNRLVFEEINHEAGPAFRYRRAGSDETGWVRTATLTNAGREPVAITLLARHGRISCIEAGIPESVLFEG